MTGKAAVLTEFHKPLEMVEYEVQPLEPGDVLVEITAAGVCGSDVHMWEGRDPRTLRPIIPGHEGVGRIARLSAPKTDVFGRKLEEGDPVLWERGIMCGKCYYCVIKKQPALCPHRLTYGLSIGSEAPPHFQGCYAEYLHLRHDPLMIKLDESVDHTTLVPATCAGATAAHTSELVAAKSGDVVVVQGPGPVGLFTTAFALDRGASRVIVIGTPEDRGRLALCKEFGATDTLVVGETTDEERKQFVLDASHGRGADVVIDCTGSPKSTLEGVRLAAHYGTYAMPGIATPVGEVPFSIFEDIARKNLRIQGSWVSDTRHLYQSMSIVLSGKYPFEKIITHTFPLEEATTALEKMKSREAMKAVLLPNG